MKLTGAAILVSRGMKVLQGAPAAYPYRSRSLLRQRHSHDLPIVPRKARPIRERRVRPNHSPSRRSRHRVRRRQDIRPTDLFISLRRQFRQNQIALLVEQNEAIAVLDEERIRPAKRLAAGCRMG